MAGRRANRRRDPMDSIIESALQPGRFIGWNQGSSFVYGLGEVEREIANLVRDDAARAVALYETFIAGCTLKAEEIDDSDGEHGTFAGSLFCGWIQARQAAGFDPTETARLLLAWIDKDEYGFSNDLDRDAVKVLDRAGLEAFERQIQDRFEAARKAAAKRDDHGLSFDRDRWAKALRFIYVQQRNIQKYLDLTGRTELTPADCEAVATMFQAKRKIADALTWVERGLGMEPQNAFDVASGRLGEMRRALLVKLRRGGEALESAWAEFQKDPNEFTYEELMRYVPKTERGAWHDRAMAASEQGDLDSIVDLWVRVKEIDRLAARLGGATDSELEGLSHYVTEPAAQRLAKTRPGVAARVYRALCVRILDTGKSKYYYAALANLEEARRCYQEAGLDEPWKTLVAEIRRDHRRKTGFMPGFEAIVAGKRARVEPSFLERARGEWARKAKA